jgi:hypothetical protein
LKIGLIHYAVASSDVQAYAAIDIEAARRGIEVALKRHLNDKYEDHAYLVKVRLNTLSFSSVG